MSFRPTPFPPDAPRTICVLVWSLGGWRPRRGPVFFLLSFAAQFRHFFTSQMTHGSLPPTWPAHSTRTALLQYTSWRRLRGSLEEYRGAPRSSADCSRRFLRFQPSHNPCESGATRPMSAINLSMSCMAQTSTFFAQHFFLRVSHNSSVYSIAIAYGQQHVHVAQLPSTIV